MDHSIGERISNRRKDLNLRLTQIQQATGISTGNLSDIEHGKKLPSANTLILLSNILNCSTDWILTGKDFIPSNSEANLSFVKPNVTSTADLNLFYDLTVYDQNEILMLIKMKYQRIHSKNDSTDFF